MPTRRQDTNPDDSQFDLEMKRAAQVLRRVYKTAEVLRCQIVDFPDEFTAQILTPKQSYRYARKPLNADLIIGDYVSVLNPGGENSGKNWEILNVTISGYASGVIDVNDFAGNIQIIPGTGIEIDSPLPNKIRITNSVLPTVLGGSGVDVQLVATQNIPNNSITAVAWDTENIDDDNFWSAVEPTKLTAQKSGWHTFGAYIEFADNTNGFRTIEAVKNGLDTLFFEEFDPNGSVIGPAMAIGGAVYLAAGDYLEIQAFQNSSSVLAINGRATLVRTAPAITSYGTTYNLQSVQEINISNTYPTYNTYQNLEATYQTYEVYQTINQDITHSYPTVLGGSLGTYVSRFTPQNVVFGSYNPVSFEYEHIDEAQYWDPAQPTRIVAPRNGWYTSSFRVHYATPGSVGTRTITIIRKNGQDDILQETGDVTSTTGGFHFNHQQQVAGTFYLEAEDYVELVLQASNTITARAHAQLALLGSYDTVYQTLAFSYPTVYETIAPVYNTLYGGSVGVYVSKASMGLGSGVRTEIDFEYEHIDEEDFWSLSEPSKIIIPRDGWYISGLHVINQWNDPNSFNRARFQAERNGSEIVHDQFETEGGGSQGFVRQSVSGPIYLNQGDYLKYFAEVNDSDLAGTVLDAAVRLTRIGSYETVYQTVINDFSTTYDFSQQNTYQSIYPNIQSPLGLGTYVSRNSNQVISSGLETAVEFDYEHRDDDELWTSGLSSRFVANKDGWYVFSFTDHWIIGDEASNRRHVIRKNGQDIHIQDSEEEYVNLSGVVPLNSGDFVENIVLQETSIPRNLQAVGTMAFFGSYITYPTYPTFIDNSGQTVYQTTYHTYSNSQWQPLSNMVLGSDGTTFDLTGIDTAKYKVFRLTIAGVMGGVQGSIRVSFNGDGGTNYDLQRMHNDATAENSSRQTGLTNIVLSWGDDPAANTPFLVDVMISKPLAGNFALVTAHAAVEDSANNITQVITTAHWENVTDLIDQITFSASQNMLAGSKVLFEGLEDT